MSNDWKQILRDARRALLALALGAVLACVLIFGSGVALSRLEQASLQAEAALGAQEAERARKTNDLADIQKHLNEFRKLISGGMVGSAEREGWVEQLIATHRGLGLPSTLNYVLQPPRAYAADNPAGDGSAPPAESGGIVAHDLLVELSAVHEADVLNLIESYRREVRGQFRVQECEFADPGETGLAARCVLRFFTFKNASPT